MKICKRCGKHFEHGNVHTFYCSRECRDANRKERAKAKNKGIQEIEKECLYCGKLFKQMGHKQKYCSMECRKEMTKSNERRKAMEKKPKKKVSTLKEVTMEARKHGMTYGKYVALIEKGIKP